MKRSRSKQPDSDHEDGASEPELTDLEPVMAEDDDFDDLELVAADDAEDELEVWTEDDDTVEVTALAAAEEAFDLRLGVAVGGMEKGAILAAVADPLRGKVAEVESQIRWQRVVVTFSGEAMIPSGVKDLVAEILKDAKPLSVTVQRGYPDESVYTGERPTCQVRRSTIDATYDAPAQLLIEVTTEGLAEEDLPMALAGELESLCADAGGKSFAFRFQGGPSPAPATYCAPLIESGASRIVLMSAGGDHVLFDRELEGLVRVSGAGGQTTVEVAGGRDLATTLRACSLVLAQSSDFISGKDVTVQLPDDLPRSELVEILWSSAKELGATGMSLGDGEIVWPPVLQSATKGNRTGLRLRDGVTPGLARSVRRDLADIPVAGQDVEFDWPEGSTPDPEVAELLLAAGPASLVCTVGHENGELIHPVPVAFRTEGEFLICEIQTSVGRPVELVPAIARHMAAQSVSGRKVDLHILGDGMLTRTMRTTLIDALVDGGASQARLIEQGQTEFLFPSLLGFETVGDDQVRVSVTVGDRSLDEVASAFASEFQARELPESTTLLVADELFVARLVEIGAARIVIEGETDVQAHPTLVRGVSRDGDQVSIEVTPDAEDLMAQVDRELDGVLAGLGDLSQASVTLSWAGESDARAQMIERILSVGPAELHLDDNGVVKQLHAGVIRSYVEVLGQRESGELPMIMLGIDTDDAEAAMSVLSGMSAQIDGRRVLVVYRAEGREVSGSDDNVVVQATRAMLDGLAKAVLQFCPRTRSRSAHFEVMKSDVEGLEVGSRTKDPRG